MYNANGKNYMYDAANELISVNGTRDDKGHLVTMTKGVVTYYYHTNGHGDVTELPDGNGNVVAQYTWRS
jgi:hypothetical protein